jgi:hypothetical protein
VGSGDILKLQAFWVLVVHKQNNQLTILIFNNQSGCRDTHFQQSSGYRKIKKKKKKIQLYYFLIYDFLRAMPLCMIMVFM